MLYLLVGGEYTVGDSLVDLSEWSRGTALRRTAFVSGASSARGETVNSQARGSSLVALGIVASGDAGSCLAEAVLFTKTGLIGWYATDCAIATGEPARLDSRLDALDCTEDDREWKEAFCEWIDRLCEWRGDFGGGGGGRSSCCTGLRFSVRFGFCFGPRFAGGLPTSRCSIVAGVKLSPRPCRVCVEAAACRSIQTGDLLGAISCSAALGATSSSREPSMGALLDLPCPLSSERAVLANDRNVKREGTVGESRGTSCTVDIGFRSVKPDLLGRRRVV